MLCFKCFWSVFLFLKLHLILKQLVDYQFPVNQAKLVWPSWESLDDFLSRTASNTLTLIVQELVTSMNNAITQAQTEKLMLNQAFTGNATALKTSLEWIPDKPEPWCHFYEVILYFQWSNLNLNLFKTGESHPTYFLQIHIWYGSTFQNVYWKFLYCCNSVKPIE